MERTVEVEYAIDKVKKALDKLIGENPLLKMGELVVKDNEYTFTYSQFGTSIGKLTVGDVGEGKTSLSLTMEVAAAHKMIVSDDTINTNIKKYLELLDVECTA